MTTSPHAVTIDAPLRRAMVREVCWHNLKAMRGQVLAIAWFGWIVGVVIATGRVGLATAVPAVLLFAGRQWLRTRRLLARELPVGQEVTVSVSGERLAIHMAEDVWLPRGSAASVHRLGLTTVVFGRSASAIVPTSVLTDEHASFLEGHGDVPDEPKESVPDTGPERIVTADLLATMVAARRSSYLRSGVMGLYVFNAVLFGGLGLAVAIGEDSPGFLVLLAAPALCALAVDRDLKKGTRALTAVHPLGSTIAVHVDHDGLRVTYVHGTVGTPWSIYQAARVRRDTVELRTRPGQPLDNVTLPKALVSQEDLLVLRQNVPRTF